MPAVNQLELHPRFASPELQGAAKELGVVLTGYGTGNSVLIEECPIVASIAKAVGKSPTQVVLRWTIQKGVVAIPRSKTIAHIHENLDVFDFELSAEDMSKLDAKDQGHPYYWEPRATTQIM